MDEIRIVDLNKEPMDCEKYRYAVCYCTSVGEGIRVPIDGPIRFLCPRCGKELGFASKYMRRGGMKNI